MAGSNVVSTRSQSDKLLESIQTGAQMVQFTQGLRENQRQFDVNKGLEVGKAIFDEMSKYVDGATLIQMQSSLLSKALKGQGYDGDTMAQVFGEMYKMGSLTSGHMTELAFRSMFDGPGVMQSAMQNPDIAGALKKETTPVQAATNISKKAKFAGGTPPGPVTPSQAVATPQPGGDVTPPPYAGDAYSRERAVDANSLSPFGYGPQQEANELGYPQNMAPPHPVSGRIPAEAPGAYPGPGYEQQYQTGVPESIGQKAGMEPTQPYPPKGTPTQGSTTEQRQQEANKAAEELQKQGIAPGPEHGMRRGGGGQPILVAEAGASDMPPSWAEDLGKALDERDRKNAQETLVKAKQTGKVPQGVEFLHESLMGNAVENIESGGMKEADLKVSKEALLEDVLAKDVAPPEFAQKVYSNKNLNKNPSARKAVNKLANELADMDPKDPKTTPKIQRISEYVNAGLTVAERQQRFVSTFTNPQEMSGLWARLGGYTPSVEGGRVTLPTQAQVDRGYSLFMDRVNAGNQAYIQRIASQGAVDVEKARGENAQALAKVEGRIKENLFKTFGSDNPDDVASKMLMGAIQLTIAKLEIASREKISGSEVAAKEKADKVDVLWRNLAGAMEILNNPKIDSGSSQYAEALNKMNETNKALSEAGVLGPHTEKVLQKVQRDWLRGGLMGAFDWRLMSPEEAAGYDASGKPVKKGQTPAKPGPATPAPTVLQPGSSPTVPTTGRYNGLPLN